MPRRTFKAVLGVPARFKFELGGGRAREPCRIHWLRNPESRVVSIQTVEAKRTEKTINAILAAVSGFYSFRSVMGTSEG